MILDSEMMMSDKQALVANTNSTNVIEIPRLAPGHNLDMQLAIRVHSESGTAPTLQATLETSSDGTNFTPVHKLVKPAGKNRFGCDIGTLRLNRYLRMSYVLGGSSPLFNVTAALAAGSDDSWQAYPDSARIS
jgi:hypothetical protein